MTFTNKRTIKTGWCSSAYFLIAGLLALFYLNPANANPSVLKNQLHDNPSPYLEMHADDPVQWQEWNADTVALAKKENKLIFVSSGYFSCHWCHVMQRESYQNKVIAALLNQYFIPVKIDRELSPGMDSRLIEFVQKTQGHAGWPLNVFLTPDGYPLFGMTYVPPEPFNNLLTNLSKQWRADHRNLENLAAEAGAELSRVERTSTLITQKNLEQLGRFFVAQANLYKDELDGGFSEQNKFPSVPQLNYLLKNHAQEWKEFLALTLDKMSEQGLRDHLYGGFFRYTIDPGWQTPHFEKMLYDNAQLAILYMDAGVILEKPKYKFIAKDTLQFLLNHFQSQEKVFIASLSAIDAEGEEGGSYVWEEEKLKALLTPTEWQVIKSYWGIDGKSELDAGHNLVIKEKKASIAKRLKIKHSELEQIIETARQKMQLEKNKNLPPTDTKKIAAWNALALQAFTKAASLYGDKVYKEAAYRIRQYIKQQLWVEQQLYRAKAENGQLIAASLEDYAYTGVAIWQWAQYANNQEDKRWVGELIKQAWEKFYKNGGWQLEENSLLKFGAAKLAFMDGPMAAPEAELIKISIQWLKEYDNKAISAYVDEVVQQGDELVSDSAFWYPTRIEALSLYLSKHLDNK